VVALHVDSVIRPVTTNGVLPPANATNMIGAPVLGDGCHARYEIEDQLQLNAYNLTDEVCSPLSGALLPPGTPRSARSRELRLDPLMRASAA
jgi:hypothetical protein